MPIPGSAGSTVFTPRGWLNPDFASYFHAIPLIRAGSRWCLGGVSGLKGFALRILPIKA
jgi:hypothetical protein